MAAYMRNRFAFFGVPTPERRSIAKVALAGLRAPTERELGTIARRCWREPQREYQYFACDYLRVHSGACAPKFLAVLRTLVTQKSWWDTVDPLSQSVGALVLAHPELRDELDRWIDDEDMWIARVALIHQLGFGARTDADRLFDYCTRRARDDEFFIRKAIGWALRQYARTDPDAVRAFVAAHSELSGLSRREALRRLG
jgi:3-methyladenine DNA glycosylase AlkD